MGRWQAWSVVAAVVAAAATAPTEARAVAEADDFVIESAADLVDLRATPPDADLYVEAVQMCHGLVSDAAQYALVLFEQSDAPFFCLPAAPPSRSAAIGEFVAWTDGHPEYADIPAPEALARFLEARFSCE